MAKTVSLQVSQRAGIGRTALKAVRKAGRVPGVLYGKTKDKTVRSRPIITTSTASRMVRTTPAFSFGYPARPTR